MREDGTGPVTSAAQPDFRDELMQRIFSYVLLGLKLVSPSPQSPQATDG